jgi:hypothetical protein
MSRKEKLIQAYKNTPWRKQFQVIGLFSATVVGLALVGGVYLTVTAQAATYGRRVQAVREEISEVERDIQDLQAELAYLTSAEYMAERLEDSDYIAVNPNRVTYLVVPGYPGRNPIDLSVKEEASTETVVKLPPEYTMSLMDWVSAWIYEIGIKTGAVEEE